MPELPEVETIRNELTPHIIGRTVTGLTLCWEGIVRQPSAEEFCSRLVGQKITGLKRRGLLEPVLCIKNQAPGHMEF